MSQTCRLPATLTADMPIDISFVDQVTQTYYLGDRSNAAVDVVDAKTGKFVTQFSAVPPFAGVGATTPYLDFPDHPPGRP